TAYPRPDAWCSPGREHVHNGACRCRGSSRTAPGWDYQLHAAIGDQRTAQAALTDVARTTPATRTAQTIAQVKSVLRRLHAAGHGRTAARVFVCAAGYSAPALTDGLAGCPAHVLVRLAAGSGFYAEPVTWEGKYGRPGRRGAAGAAPAAPWPRCPAWSPRTSPLPTLAGARGAGRSPAPEPRARRDPHPAGYPA